MYAISPEVLDLFKRNYRQIVNISYRGKTLTESDILQGGLSIDRYCISGSRIEIGSAIAAELSIKLDNRDERFADEVFEGAELEVQIGIKKWDAYQWENAQIHWIPCGLFTVDEPPRKLSNIKLTALDRMVRFDVPVDKSDLEFPMTVGTLLQKCCLYCRVPLFTDPSTLANCNYSILEYPSEDEITYRQLIQWIAEITATCAYIDWNGELRLEWYSQTDTTITSADRYSSEMHEQDITITGVQITDLDNNIYLAGTDSYAFNVENNGLIQHDYDSVANAIFQKVKGFVYRPYTCKCKPLPHVYPLDMITYYDKKGVAHPSIISNVNFTMNKATSLEGKGETNVQNGWASANPLTKGEAIVLKKLEHRIDSKISSREQAALNMNEIMSNSLGLYRSSITEKDGSISYYYHDKATLASSSIIYTFKSGGFAWTNKWDDEETVWHYGITKDGNAVLNMLSVYKLTADYIEAGAITTDKLAIGAIGGFTITPNYIQHGGKTSYNDGTNGVFISPDGIGLGAGKLYMTAAGKLHAEEAEITGTINAHSGRIGGWYIGVYDGYIRSATSTYGTFRYSTTGADLRYVTGYAFFAITPAGFAYVVKATDDYDNSATLKVLSELNDSSGGTITPGGDIFYV